MCCCYIGDGSDEEVVVSGGRAQVGEESGGGRMIETGRGRGSKGLG
jgi:hypothetical protein